MEIDGKIIDKTPFGVIQIISYLFLVMFLTILVTFFYLKEKWQRNWDYYRCKSYLIPFTPILKPGDTITENYNFCYKKKIDPIFKRQVKNAFDEKIKDSSKLEEKTKVEIENTQNEMNTMAKETTVEVSFFVKIYNRLRNVSYYTLIKIQHFFMKIGAIIWVIYYQVITQINTILIQIATIYKTLAVMNTLAILVAAIGTIFLFPPAAVLSGIILALLIDINATNKAAEQKAYCCFERTSRFYMNNHHLKKISEIEPGETLIENNKVIGIIHCYTDNVTCYKLNEDTRVTGDHIIYDNENEKWQTVNQYINNTKSKHDMDSIDYVYSLVTEKNIIKATSGYSFRDYEEINNTLVQKKISEIILRNLNKNCNVTCNEKFEKGESVNCLSPDTKIKMKDGTFKEIREVKIHDELFSGVVMGIYKCVGDTVDWFCVKNNILGSKIICFVDDKWNKTYNVGKLVEAKYKCGYHLITTNHILNLEKDLVIRDFIETDDSTSQNQINDLVIGYLNYNSTNV